VGSVKTQPKPNISQLDKVERTQNAVIAFHMGFNVFPLTLNSKLPIYNAPSKPLDYMRLCWQETELRKIFTKFDCNIGIKLGETSLNLLVVDIDDFERALEALTRLATHGLHTHVIKSANRGYHLYFRCADCAIGGGKFSYGDIKGRGGYVLFPGSAVDGKPYSFVDGSEPYTDTLSNLQPLLTDVLGETITLKPTTFGHGIWHDLPAGSVVQRSGRFVALYNEYLNTPTPEGNRKNKLYKNAHYAMATGQALDEVESAARRDGLPQSEIDRTVTAAQHDHILRHTPIGGQSWHWHTAMQSIDSYRGWSSGQQGITERAIMHAMVERARLDANQQGIFRASIREIKQLSQKSYTPAVNNALKRLVEKGLLIRVSGSRQRDLQDCATAQPVNGGRQAASTNSSHVSQKLQASRWRFGDTVLQNLHSRDLRSQNTDVFTVYVTQQHEFTQDTRLAELLERGALGQTAVRVYCYLIANNGAPSQTVIATSLGVNRATVSRVLKKCRAAITSWWNMSRTISAGTLDRWRVMNGQNLHSMKSTYAV
jgi:hypothetical protein